MNENDDEMIKVLAEMDGRQDHSWYCPKCREQVHPNHVTFGERHDERAGGCGFVVHADLPDYLNFLDAIQALVLK